MSKSSDSLGYRTLNSSIDKLIDSRTSKKETLKTATIGELLRKYNNSSSISYTPEENELHQRLVNLLSSQVDHDEVRKEEVKRLRMERKLERSRK